MADIVLLAVFAAAGLFGAWRGALRQLLVAGAWLASFIAAAYARDVIARWIGPQQPQLTWEYTQMISFLGVFTVLFVLAVLILEFTGKRVDLSRRQQVDDMVGGLLAVGLAVLVVASVMTILDSYYKGGFAPSEEVDAVHALYMNLADSNIGQLLHGSLVSGLALVLGPFLPFNAVHVG